MVFSVRWRDYGSGHQHRLTVRSQEEARSLARYLSDHGTVPTLTQLPPPSRQGSVPSVADVVQEHIDLLVRPSSGTIGTYQRMLDLHIQNTVGHIPVDEFGYREVMRWIKGLTVEGVAPKSIHNSRTTLGRDEDR